MNLRDFRRAGHWPTLLCAFLYFDISFMVWVLLGALGNALADEFDLSPGQKGLMVAVPLLGGAAIRLVMGVLTDRLGARRMGLIGLTLTAPPLLLGWLWVDSFEGLLLVGLLLGVPGASFAAALPLASRWYPPKYQGLAMGIAGAGNSGTALATLFGPRLAEAYGWHAVFALALVPVAAVWALFLLLAKDSPSQPAPRPVADYLAILRQRDAGWFCLFYAVTFGGFVGLASFLSLFFRDQYGLGAVAAGNFATLCVISGSFLRPVGGHVADRVGGIRLLAGLFLGVAALMIGLAASPPLAVGTALLLAVMALLGLGNGAVFQLVPLRFPREIGVVTGVVGAAGGIGGFFLPNALGLLKAWTGSFGGGFLAFAAASAGAAAALSIVGRSWEGAFVGRGGLAADPAPAGEIGTLGTVELAP